MLKLTKLTYDMEKEFYDYIKEWNDAKEKIIPASCNMEDLTYPEYMISLKNFESIDTCPSGLVPADTYFLVDDTKRILGAINIRHSLNDNLLKFCGHIGYGIRPSERRKGYASKMLHLALPLAKTLGLKKVLITCLRENIGSSHTILKNGGILENELKNGDKIFKRYWIVID